MIKSKVTEQIWVIDHLKLLQRATEQNRAAAKSRLFFKNLTACHWIIHLIIQLLATRDESMTTRNKCFRNNPIQEFWFNSCKTQLGKKKHCNAFLEQGKVPKTQTPNQSGPPWDEQVFPSYVCNIDSLHGPTYNSSILDNRQGP